MLYGPDGRPFIKAPETRELAGLDRELYYMLYALRVLPNPDPLLRKLGRTISVYREILSDGRIEGLLEARKAAVVTNEWQILPWSGDEKDQEIAEFVRSVIDNLDFTEDMKQMLNAVWYGYAVLELMWKEKDGKWIIWDIRARDPEGFGFDPKGDLLFFSKDNPNGEDVPKEKFLVVRYNREKDTDFYGRPLASKVYWLWFFKKAMMKFWAQYAENYGDPTKVGKYPAGDTRTKDALLEALRETARAASIVIPDNAQIDFLKVAERPEVYEAFIRLLNNEIAIAIVGATLTSDIGDKGSYAAAKVHQEVRNDLIQMDSEMVMGVVNNQLIRYLVGFNYGWDAPLPYFQINYRKLNLEQELKIDEGLSRMGVPLSLEEIYERYGRRKPADLSDTLMPQTQASFSDISKHIKFIDEG